MYGFWHNLLSDKKEGEIFSLFGASHFFYIILSTAALIAIFLVFKGKPEKTKQRVLKFLSGLAFSLYVADFFLMPLAYGEIDIEKLPFHVCTAMCVMCFLSYRVSWLAKYRISFVFLGLISNLVYLIYPAGVMWHAVHPFSYRVIQTLLFHSVMTVYGVVTLVYDYGKIEIKRCYRDFAVIVCMTAWALFGNYVYNGTGDGYSHFFNWFFVVRDPFYAIPETVAPFVMPLLNTVLFFAVEMLLHLVIFGIQRKKAAPNGGHGGCQKEDGIC